MIYAATTAGCIQAATFFLSMRISASGEKEFPDLKGVDSFPMFCLFVFDFFKFISRIFYVKNLGGVNACSALFVFQFLRY